MRLIWRILVIVIAIYIVKGFIAPEPQVFISSPEAKLWVERLEWEATKIQKAAQDLPASIEMTLRRLLQDSKPLTEAKSV